MKILHIPHAYFPVVGGAENNCRRFSEILATQGHDVHVLTTNVGAVQAYYEFGISRVDRPDETIGGVCVTRLPFSNGLYQLGGWIKTKLRPRWLSAQLAGRIMVLLRRSLTDMITRQIAEIRPDVVMTMPHLVVNVEAVLAARRRMTFPLIMVPMLHEHDPNWDVGVMATALRLADAVIALTPHEAGRLTEAYGVPSDRVFVASVGIDLDETVSASTERLERVIFLGRKVRSKGIDSLIEAMGFVWKVMPEAELWLAGRRLPETAEIDRQIAALPGPRREQIKNADSISDAEKAALLKSARCLVLPSKVESFGMVILEAWAHATPVVAWDLPVFRSIVEDGRTGVLADAAGGPRALGEAILRLLKDTKAAARMGEAGYRRAAALYSWQSVAAVYLKAYEFAQLRATPLFNDALDVTAIPGNARLSTHRTRGDIG